MISENTAIKELSFELIEATIDLMVQDAIIDLIVMTDGNLYRLNNGMHQQQANGAYGQKCVQSLK